MKRLSTGFKEVDSLMGGGIPEGYAVMLCGAPGAGKTMYALRFLAVGVEKKEKVAYISYNEPVPRLIRRAANFKQTSVLKDGHFIETRLESPGYDPFEVIKIVSDMYPPPSRVVIDSLNKLFTFNKSDMSRRILLHQLLDLFRERNITALMVYEHIPKLDENEGFEKFCDELLYECDGIINLHVNRAFDKLTRKVEIPKMRDSPIDYRMLEFDIVDKKGLVFGKTVI